MLRRPPTELRRCGNIALTNRRRPLLVVLAVLTAGVLGACGPELGPIAKLRDIPAPRLPETSDASVVRSGSTYYVYGSNNHVRAPVMRTTDLGRSYTLAQKNALVTNAMPTKPAWTARAEQLWAPTVARFGSTWVMYFSADRSSGYVGNNRQCLGRATASSPLGPFTPSATPVHCGINGVGGVLDPEFYRDPTTGRMWLLAAFSNTEAPLRAFPINASGGFAGQPALLLERRHSWEYHFIENPAMVYDPTRGSHLLAYSAGRWWEARYSTGIARCSGPTGPCTSDPSGPWVASSASRTGPGGLSFFTNAANQPRVIFSTFPRGGETTNGNRSASIMPLTLQPAVGLGQVTK